MARPIKEGLDYFPLDVDFHSDEKIEIITGEFGVKGEAIAIRLLCAIYRQGYYIKWSEALKYKLAKQTGLSANLIQEVLTRLVKWDFFNEALFNSSDVLTSRGIQKRYKQITKKRKAEAGNYWILDFPEFPQQKPAETIVNSEKTPVNSQKSAQSKVKESKGKESKVEVAETETSTTTTKISKNTFDASEFLPSGDQIADPPINLDSGKIIATPEQINQFLRAIGANQCSVVEEMAISRAIEAGCTVEHLEQLLKDKPQITSFKSDWVIRELIATKRKLETKQKGMEHYDPSIY